MNEAGKAVITRRTELREQFISQLEVVSEEEAKLKQLELDARTVDRKSDDPNAIIAAKQAVKDQALVVEDAHEWRLALESAVKTANKKASAV